MEQFETVQENSQSCWHLIEKKELQSELDQLAAKRDKLEEKKMTLVKLSMTLKCLF